MTESNVGTAAVYEAKDQRTVPESEREQPERHHEGKENSHRPNDSKDERSIKERLDAAGPQNDDQSGKDKTDEQKAAEIDPTLPAKMHGNEPSKGAKIDAQIMAEEEEELRKKDEAKAQKKANKH